MEKTRSGNQLLKKLISFSSEDIERLNKILDNWTVKDALIVLDEIDKRILMNCMFYIHWLLTLVEYLVRNLILRSTPLIANYRQQLKRYLKKIDKKHLRQQ